ncbi:MAG TPA: hypothetical protein VKZ53_02605 [Candidatus Angelobacter sp.]|nr:hypothetical protein [Candidatus Angelobacter sp.]
MDANNPDSIQPTHQVVVAQTPYGNGWVQATTFKKYTKHTREREELEAKLPECDGMKDIEAKFEAALVYDPWETGQHYVAGISYPDGDLQLLANKPRNTAVDYVIGVCPDFKVACDELLTSTEVKRLLEMTEKDKLGFWKQGAPSKRPHLYDETKEEAQTLIMLAVRQALAGPCDFSKKWHGQPVSKLVEHLYCDHLNNRNRQISRVPKQEQFTEH